MEIRSEWKDLFDERTLKKGWELVQKNMVVNRMNTTRGVVASVLGRRRREIEIIAREGSIVRMYCRCPKARSGKNCEHMAAVLWSIPPAGTARPQDKAAPSPEGEGTADDDARKQEQQRAEEARLLEEKRAREEERRQKEQEEAAYREAVRQKKEEEARRREEMRRRELEKQKEAESENPYQYYDADRILDSMHISPEVMTKAEEVVRQDQIIIERVRSSYRTGSREIAGQICGTGIGTGGSFSVRLDFERTKRISWDCSCPACCRNYYSRVYGDICRCEYIAALGLKLREYLATHTLGDATDFQTAVFLDSFRKIRENVALTKGDMEPGSLRLEPKLVKKDGKLRLFFRIGQKKLFAIRSLKMFCSKVRLEETAVYGAQTEFPHGIRNFCDEGKGWIRFLEKLEQDEREQEKRSGETGVSDYPSAMGNYVPLSGWRLDAFYRELGERSVEYEDRDAEHPVKTVLTCAEGRKPRGHMTLSRLQPDGDDGEPAADDVFHGVLVKGVLPQLYYGAEAVYYLENDRLLRADRSFRETLRPLDELLKDSRELELQVGRNSLADFYYKVLPELEKVFWVTEKDPELFRSYLQPQVQFRFWMDAYEDYVVCRAEAVYGDRRFSVLDLSQKDRSEILAQQRDVDGELSVLKKLNAMFPRINLKHDILWIDGTWDLNGMLYLLRHAADELLQLGEVNVTRRFRARQEFRKVKLSVGVSMSGGLLNLDIAAEDMTQQELLDVLKAYRAKKRYYRLKNGTCMDLDDSALVMLAELMDTAHIPPKEILKGKLDIPLYRALYLDRLLEEHSEVYSDRDVYVRRIVKCFKAVNEADFEVPKTLRRTLRGYQKTGYQWLRTLSAWGFGGILADEMGLGKTLQMIAVLLAAKQEGKRGMTLIVTPASLVFNWGEEFKRFAPQLCVRLVTGTQEERQQILKEPGVDVLVTSYDLLKRDIGMYEEMSFLYEVIDEAQYIKNHTTAASKAVKAIHSRTRFALTGTPIENRLSELWSIFDYLMPGFLYSYETFRREIETPVAKQQEAEAMQRLQKLTGPFILRRLKEQVLRDLPEKLEENRYVSFGAEQKELYDAQLSHMKTMLASQDESGFNKNRIQILAELTKLRQICCDPSLCFEYFSGTSAKEEACLDLVRSAMDGGHRMLIFSQFTSMLEILRKQLEAENIPYYLITGETKTEERLELVKQFNDGDVPVFLISLKAGGVGLNLTGADVVIHYDPWWNVAAQNQATDRAHRIGQTKKVTVYKLVVKDSIEEKIQELQEKKRSLAQQVIGGETGQLAGMSREDILELLKG